MSWILLLFFHKKFHCNSLSITKHWVSCMQLWLELQTAYHRTISHVGRTSLQLRQSVWVTMYLGCHRHGTNTRPQSVTECHTVSLFTCWLLHILIYRLYTASSTVTAAVTHILDNPVGRMCNLLNQNSHAIYTTKNMQIQQKAFWILIMFQLSIRIFNCSFTCILYRNTPSFFVGDWNKVVIRNDSVPVLTSYHATCDCDSDI